MKRLKNPFVLFALAVASFFIHNFIYAVTRVEEAVFFLLTFVFGFAFVFVVVSKVFSRRNRD